MFAKLYRNLKNKQIALSFTDSFTKDWSGSCNGPPLMSQEISMDYN